MATAAMKVGERKKKVIIDTDPGIGPYRPSILLVSSPVSTAIDCNQPVDRSFPWRRRRDGHPGGAAVAGAGGAGPHHHLRQRPHRPRHAQRAPPGSSVRFPPQSPPADGSPPSRLFICLRNLLSLDGITSRWLMLRFSWRLLAGPTSPSRRDPM